MIQLFTAVHVVGRVNAGARDLFTTNTLCRQNRCINPVFPGLETMQRYEAYDDYQCVHHDAIDQHLHFCKGIVNYDASISAILASDLGNSSTTLVTSFMQHAQTKSTSRNLLATNSRQSGATMQDPVDIGPEPMIQAMDGAALTEFFYHISAMGLEAREYQLGTDHDDCANTVKRLACYAAFPRCSAGSMPGEPSSYLRVCSNACNHYVKACGIECCDDSVQCVFEHEKQVPGLDLVKSSGFSSSSGPSSFCTGAAGRDGLSSLIIMSAVGIFSLAHSGAKFSMRSFKMFMYVLTVAATGCLLQGCDSGNQFDVDLDFPSHSVPVWRTSQDYWIKYQYLSEESAGPKMSKINSCADMASEGVRVCSGRGVCKLFGPGSDGLLFCECDSLYADPECGTERKSQLVVYALSLFLGFTGADLFYLGYPVLASLKLCSLGGLGFWWAYDIIRVGSSPVYADSYRVAQDLPHWAFVLTTVGVACCVGFIWAINSAAKQVRIKRTELLLAGSNC